MISLIAALALANEGISLVRTVADLATAHAQKRRMGELEIILLQLRTALEDAQTTIAGKDAEIAALKEAHAGINAAANEPRAEKEASPKPDAPSEAEDEEGGPKPEDAVEAKPDAPIEAKLSELTRRTACPMMRKTERRRACPIARAAW